MNLEGLAGGTAVVTGASTGIGRVVATQLAVAGVKLVLIGRSAARHEAVTRDVRLAGGEISQLETDLADLGAVARAANVVVRSHRDLSIVVNNAGLGGQRGTTVDGFELAFGVNYLSHFLLVRTMFEAGLAPHFIVNLSSDAHYAAKTFDLGRAVGPTRSLTGWPEYARSKAAMASHIIELAARFPAIHCVAVHPGTVATEIWRRIPGPLRWLVTRSMGSPAEGAQVVLRAMTDPDVKSGSYLTPAGARQPSGLVKAPEQRQALWERSMEWVERFT